MLTFNSTEMDVVRVWAERGEGSPFPQEIRLLNRINNVLRGNSFTATKSEVEIIFHWAEQDTAGHYGTEKYLLEKEAKLYDKIEEYLNLD